MSTLPSHFVYEVNLTIEKPTFLAHKTWLISHFHDMVTENKFSALRLYFVKNMNPIDDNHLRYQKVVAQYIIPNEALLNTYLEKLSHNMRSQVTERLGRHYTIERRVFELAEIFTNSTTSE